MNRILLLGVAGSALFLLPGDCADAGCHPVAVQRQAVVAYQPIQQPYYWAVGQQLQDDAKAERIANLVIQKLQAAQLSAPGIPDNSPQTLPLTAEVDRWANTKQVCAGCHTTGADAMSHINMNDFSTLTCEQKINAIKQMMEGKMPPPDKSGKQKLSDFQLGQIIGEFVGADNVSSP